MNCERRFRALAPAVLVTVSLFAGAAWAKGQTTPVASIGTRMPSAGFMSAPGFGLSEVPSGVVSTDLDGDGKPDLVVSFALAGKVVVYLGAGAGKFQAPVAYSVSGHPVAVAAVDVNGDGQPDIVTANGADGTVSVLPRLAGGKLGAASISRVGSSADYLAASDLNGDGLQDVVVASRSEKALAILLNDSHGALQAATVQSLGKTPTGLITGDFNGDHHVDAAVAIDDGTVEVFAGGGDGTLKLAASFAVSSASIGSLAAADFNRDGNLDLAVTQADGRILTTFPGRGDGTFGQGVSYAVGNVPVFTAAIDVNGDGFVDLLSVNQGSNTVSVLLGKGDGSFQNANTFAVGDGPVALAAGDFYSTGITGLVVVDGAGKMLNAIAGKGDGTFRAAPSYSGDLSPRAIASGDLNGDGLADLVVANFCGPDKSCARSGSLSVYLGQASGGYKLASTEAAGVGPVSVALADLNGDGNPDVVALNRGDKTLSVLLGVGDGTLREPSTTALVGSPVAVVAKDFNQDGQIDLAVLSDCGSVKCAQPGRVDVYFGGGDGSFALGASYAVSYSPRSIAAGDLNGDGVLDLVVANACGKDASCSSAGTATVLMGGVNGIFVAQPDIVLNNEPSSIALRSAKSKGALDMVVTHEADNTVAVLKGNGDGTFQTPALYAVGSSPRSIAIADLNGDGTPDVAVANAKDSTVSVLYGKSDGTLVAGGSYAVAAGPEALTAVSSVAGRPASLVTANGNSTSTPVGSEITSLANASPNVGSSPSSTSLAITATTPTVNGSVTLTATVTDANTLLPLSGETVVFTSDVASSSDGTTITDCATATTDNNGMVSCTTSELPGGSRTVAATFNGDPTYAISSGQQTQSINMANTTISLASASTPMVNQPATFTATLNGIFTPTAPSGTITFTTLSGNAIQGCPATSFTSTSTAPSPTCTVTPTAAGAPDIMVSYSGDVNFNSSTGTSSQTVSKIPATLTLVVPDPNAIVTVNQPVTFTANFSTGTATIAPTAPNGTITFTVAGAIVSSCAATTPVTTATAAATCTVTPTATGSLSVTAAYTDANYVVATTANSPVTQTITKVPATLTLVVPDPSAVATVNQPVTFTANFSTGNAAITPTAPNGTITFTVTGAINSTCAATTPVTTATATATCTVTPTAAGTLSVAAAYTDTNYAVATTTNSPVSQAISKIPATLTLVVPDPNAVVTVNQPVTFTANFSTGNSAITPTAPNGTIAFTVTGAINSTCAATTPVTTATATATCTVTPTAAGTLSVAAAYTDTNYAVATTANSPVSQAITKIPATLTLVVPDPNAVVTVNQPVTFTANFSTGNSAITPTAPNGTITFTVTGAINSTCAATTPVTTATATATCTVTPTAAGTLSVAAAYSDSNYAVATTANSPVSQTVTPIQATLTVASSAPSSTVNQQVTFTATLSVPSGKSFTPTAPSQMISFTANGSAIPGCGSMAPSGTPMAASCTTSSLPTGSYTIVASYASDPNYTVSNNGNSPSITQTVAKIAASLALAGPSAAMTVNQPVTFTANFSTGNAAITPIAPNGTITFTVTGSVVSACGTTSVNSGSVTASCAVTPTAAGSLTVTASYADANYSVSAPTPAFLTQTVNKITPTLSLAFSSNPSPAVVNEPVTYTATVVSAAPGATLPGGSVTFTQAGISICGLVGLTPSATNPTTSSTATCNVTFSSQGTSSAVTASYNGDSNFTPPSPSSTTATTFIVAAATTATTLASSGSTSTPVVNQNVTFTATITPQFTGSTMLSGAVTFTDQTSGSALCSNVAVTVNNSIGSASCTMPLLSQGSHTVQAAYTSSTQNFGSSSITLVQMVNPENSAISLSASPASATVNQQVTFIATVTRADPTFPGNTAPQGSVSFTENGTTIGNCGAVVLASGSASCMVSFANATTHNITATFISTTNFVTSSTTIPEAVGSASTSVGITSSVASPTVDQSVTFAATLTFAPGSGIPTGSINFTDTSANSTSAGTVFCSAPLVGSSSPLSATCSMSAYSFLTFGPHQVTANYATDGSFAASANNFSVNVGATPTTLAVTASSQPAPPVVDQPVSFAINLMTNPVILLGTARPQGTVTLTDSVQNKVLCTQTVAADGSVPSCVTSFLAVGTHTISASFAPTGSNFVASTAPAVTQVVQPTGTTLIVTSSSGGTSPTSVATQQVIFTATLVPAFTGASLPSGTVAFTLTGDTVDTCLTVAVTTSAQPYTATCTINFASSISGSVTVKATYTPTPLAGGANFQGSTGTATQNVQNFKPTFAAASLATAVTSAGSAIASPIVTQGYTTSTDPFNPNTIMVTSSPSTSFADPVTVTSCAATNGAGASLSCTVVNLANTGTGNVATLTLSPTASTPIGTYTVTVMVADSKVPALVQTTTLTVNVVAQVVASSLSAGAATGAFNVPFSVPSSTASYNFACSTILFNGQISTAISCKPNVASGTVSSNLFTITAGPVSSAMTLPVRPPSQRVFVAAFFGIPLFALAGCLRRRGSRTSFMRFLAAVIVLAGASQVIGCGGGFTTTSATTATTGPAVGTYLVLVTAKDAATGITYDAVVSVAIRSATGS